MKTSEMEPGFRKLLRTLREQHDAKSAPSSASAIPPMPEVNPRRLFDDDQPNGYLESLNDWYHNNEDAVEWFLENAEAIRVLLTPKQ